MDDLPTQDDQVRNYQGKKMSQRRVQTLFSVREGTSMDDLPTQDDQVRNYQWTQKRRFELQRGKLQGIEYMNTTQNKGSIVERVTKFTYAYVMIKVSKHYKEKGCSISILASQ
ncbi:hypothetical protein Tco_1050667 [Tanacetum coccineum]